MAAKDRDPTISAVEAIYAALKEVDVAERQKVLSSALALLGIEGPPGAVGPRGDQSPAREARQTPSASSPRPLSLVELVNEKRPGGNAQRIALFAYYREKVEQVSRFSREDLRGYFAKAKLAPASNYDRDFVEAVRRGWIHEDGSDSYLTTKGIEAVESGFEGERKATQPRRSKSRAKKKGTKRTSRKSKKR